MTGNATEEYLLTRLDYPGHLDAGRMAGLAGSAAGIAAGLATHALWPGWVALPTGLGVGALVGARVWRAWTRRALDAEAQALAAGRARAERETRARIAEMRRKEMDRGVPRAAERG